jgi:hypothetical protein
MGSMIAHCVVAGSCAGSQLREAIHSRALTAASNSSDASWSDTPESRSKLWTWTGMRWDVPEMRECMSAPPSSSAVEISLVL